MISREVQSIPKEKKAFEVFILKVLREHYQDIKDIYQGEAVISESIILEGEDSRWRITVDGEDLVFQKEIGGSWESVHIISGS